jgi:hypothetical protein
VDSENINLKIGHGRVFYQFFSKIVAKIGKSDQKFKFLDFFFKVSFLNLIILKLSLMCSTT